MLFCFTVSLADEDQFESLEDEHNDTAESETAEHPEQNDVDDNHTDGHQVSLFDNSLSKQLTVKSASKSRN